MPGTSPTPLLKEAAAVHRPSSSWISHSILLGWPGEELEDLAADTQWTSVKIKQDACSTAPSPEPQNNLLELLNTLWLPGIRGTKHGQHAKADPEELLRGCTWKLPGAAVIRHSERTAEHHKTEGGMEEP